MFRWTGNRSELEAVFRELAAADIIAIEHFKRGVHGVCSACSRPVDFRPPTAPEGIWVNYSEAMVCPHCGTNGRMRAALEVLKRATGEAQPQRSLIFERLTPVYVLLSRQLPGLIGCEFLGPDKEPGHSYQHAGIDVRHEDMTKISFADDTLDLVMHFDVLEHVPDHRAALKECYRVLRPGGSLVFSVPFYPANETHVVRGQMEDGEFRKLMPDVYHGNPVGGGALVVIEPGWNLLSDIAEAGFDGRVGIYHDEASGVSSNGCPWAVGKCWPIAFHCIKPQR